ncbi:alpha/beta hydrolase [Acidovorax sp. GBBC 3334]|uniref:alpha/beta fold hydrolase n=1 Tax=unclassified Acidovorax TaxID=2684926 RepID=UPI0023044C16|nr:MULTISPECIES: alpha/beta fold hydrolase [unclassified Acidovorax]MDA8455750.1 alpha/beta hydrolase [Acidovorax sp. GBBC 3334]MDA8523190.1 alpha/beta hydrolase [Acidovorax sp. NCPPB 4044]
MALLPTFTTLGAGPTVLMLHDADGGHLTFAPQVETLASAGYRAVAWDMPGYGHSAPIEPYGFKGLAQSCIALLDALQCAEGATLIGHGLGAMVAVEVAARAPRRVGRLVLCAGGPALDGEGLRTWVAPRLQALEGGESMERIAQLLVPRQSGTGAHPEGARLAGHAMGLVHRATFRRALDLLPAFARDASDLAHLAMPTLLVSGAQDPCMPPEALQALAHVLPDARHLSLPHVGHWPQLEDPDNFDAAVLDFLGSSSVRVVH